MKTVPTIAASSSALAASALGLVFARQDSGHDLKPDHNPAPIRAPTRRIHSAPLLDMTAAVASPVDSPHSYTFTAATPYSPELRPVSRSTNGSRAQSPNYVEQELGIPKRSLKRTLGKRSGTPLSMDSAWSAQEVDESQEPSNTTRSSWYKRLSTFSSNDGSITSGNRPHSVAVSQSNASLAFSNAGSTTPIFPSFSPTPAPPNKLVKRSSSVRSTRVGSRIPIPTFKKPATSHERDANIQDLQRSASTATSALPRDSTLYESTGLTLKSFFTPKISFDSFSSMSKRSSTSIPNPIKRVMPDRRYLPVLVSAREDLRRASIDFERLSMDQPPTVFNGQRDSVARRASRRFFSSPLPQRPETASTSTSASGSRLSKTDGLKRTFSFSKRSSYLFQGQADATLESSGTAAPRSHPPAPVPKWKRPSKLRGSDSKNPYKKGQSTVLAAVPIVAAAEPSGTKRHSFGLAKPTVIPSEAVPLPPSTQHVEENQNIPVLNTTLAGTDAAPREETRVLSSPAEASRQTFQGRQSGTLSEFTSSFGGSDSDAARYLEDDCFDSPNDTFFDSVRTRATSASSTGLKGTRIDTFFDKSADKPSGAVADSAYQSPRLVRDTFERPRHSIIEEEDNMPTPVRPQRNGSARQSPMYHRTDSSPTRNIPSSPPSLPRMLRRKSSFDHGQDFGDTEDVWDFDEDDKTEAWPTVSKFPSFEFDAHPADAFDELQVSTLGSPLKSPGMVDQRNNIFDWSEQHPVDKMPSGSSPPRPRTVHGKKAADSRGSRSAGRRAPSGFHARSQSVPVVPEMDGKRPAGTNKFGTWGVGSKGVTEDWNEDFDFEEPAPALLQAHQSNGGAGVRHASEGMQVPKAIQEQQINVLRNIDLLRDWGLLIEELKDLRGRAQVLNLRESLDNAMWHEVDAMIDLADQESNDHTLDPRHSPPSSPTFDDSAFDDPAPAVAMRNSPRVVPRIRAEDIFDSPSSSPLRKLPGTPENNTPRRPRKDSEAVARSVIEALQQRRNMSDPTGSSPGKMNKKVPFDTATLRRIVPYVQELRDKVKRSIREAEGLHDSPRLDDTPEGLMPRLSELSGNARRENGHDKGAGAEGNVSRSPPDEMSRRMELLTVG